MRSGTEHDRRAHELRPPAWIGGGCLVGALVLGLAAFAVAGADSSDLSAPAPPPAASMSVPPSTVAPLMTAPTTLETTPSAPTTTTEGPPPTTLPPSPLAALLGARASAVPAAPAAPLPPVHVRIDALELDVPVEAVGVAADGQLEIPDETHVGWYRLGSSPGQPGATVLAAHVNWHGVDGPFVRLGQLEPGATVVVTVDDATTRTYQVVERRQHPKHALPADRVWTRTGPETLVLITCGGSYDADTRRYRDNIVVHAVPVA